MFGIASAILGRYLHSASAMVESQAYFLHTTKLMTLMKGDPNLAAELVRLLALKVELLSLKLETLTFMNPYQRVAYLLLRFSNPSGRSQVLTLTQEQLANMAMISRVLVNKILGRFSRMGLIGTRRGSVEIVNRPGLLQVLSHNPLGKTNF